MADDDDWSKEQMKPLAMFDLATKWADAIKVIGAGNGAGVVAAGAALSTFSQRPDILVWVKCAGVSFFIGVFAFALGFAFIHLSMFTYDEMLHATRRKDVAAIEQNSATSSTAMVTANWLAIVAAITFFIGLSIGLIAFLKV